MCKVIAITSDKPRTGKSLCGELLHKYLSEKGFKVAVMAFNDKLIEMTATLVGESTEEFLYGYDSLTVDITGKDDTTWYKDHPIYMFQGSLRSKREMLIWCSEYFIKPHISYSFFGDAVVKRITKQDYVIVTGIGFISEAISVINRVGSDNLTIVQLKRDIEGESTKCSRKMLTPEDFNENMCPHFIEVCNDGTKEELLNTLINSLKL